MNFGNWLLFPFRTRARSALSLAVLAVLAYAGWQGYLLLSFQRHLTAGQQALANFDFPKAEQEFADCLEYRPKDAAVLLAAAQATRRAGLLDKAEEYLNRYDRVTGSSTPEGLLQLTLLQVQRGNVKKHVYSLLNELEIRHPASEQILESLAQGSNQVYRLDEASFWIKQLLDRFPENPIGRLMDAQMNETMHHREKALETTRNLFHDYPENEKVHLYFADLLFKSHKYEKAAEHFRELHRQYPENLPALLGLISTLLMMEKVDEVKPLLDELKEKHANNPAALLERGRYELNQHRPAEAEPLLRRALKLSPNNLQIHFVLATTLDQLNKNEESRQHLEKYKKIEADMIKLDQAFKATIKTPNDPAPRVEAAKICMRNGQVSEGLRWLSGVLDLYPDHKLTHKLIADYYQSVGNLTEAEYHRIKAQ